ncbi:MAG: hypothetical protein GY865_15490 [candidate division Zixibacteria bacterium]|nr:hypothetical protein [candidate division Zixibacteria bacterium]
MSQSGQRKLIEFISLILFSPIYLLVKLIPKNKYLHIYGSSLGLNFSDNSKYLFLYASKNIKTIKSVYISRNKNVVAQLINNGYCAEYLYSYNGIKAVLTAKKAFINHSVRDIHPLLLGGAEIIQLWHGTPLKKIGYDADWITDSTITKIKFLIRRIIYCIFPYMYSSRWFDKVIASSDETVVTFKTAFGITDKRIEVIGQPRNDCLNLNYEMDKTIFPEIEYLEKLKNKFDTVIAWLPTHRATMSKSILDLMDNHNFNLETADNFLKENKIGMIIKPHFLEKESLVKRFKNSDDIIVYDFVDPYPLLRYTDILITDYSSVYFDFLLLNRPIIFTPFDYENYIRTNGSFYYDYNEVTPGPKCSDWNEVILELEKTLVLLKNQSTDPFLEKRIEISNKFNYYKEDYCRKVADRFILNSEK